MGGPQAKKRAAVLVSWSGGLMPGPGWPTVLGRSLPVLASLSQMWRLATMIPPGLPVTRLSW